MTCNQKTKNRSLFTLPPAHQEHIITMVTVMWSLEAAVAERHVLLTAAHLVHHYGVGVLYIGRRIAAADPVRQVLISHLAADNSSCSVAKAVATNSASLQ